MTGFQRLALATTAATLVLIVIGAIVRVTGSGLGCPDWPKCHGQYIPPFEKEVMIEYSHRLAASVVGLLVLGTAAVVFLRHRRRPVLVVLAAASLLLLAVQVSLGGVTVVNELPPEVVTAHLAVALALFATLVSITTISLRPDRGGAVEPDPGAVRLQRWLLAGAVAVYLVLLSGSYVVGAGASLVTLDWPLVDGSLFPSHPVSLTERLLRIQWLHRFSVLLAALVLVVVLVRAHRLRADRGVLYAAWAAAGLYVAQVFIGAANIWTRLHPSVPAAHLAVGSMVWAAMVAAFTLNRLAVTGAPAAEQQRLAAAAEGRR